MKFEQGFKESSVEVVHFRKHTDFYKDMYTEHKNAKFEQGFKGP